MLEDPTSVARKPTYFGSESGKEKGPETVHEESAYEIKPPQVSLDGAGWTVFGVEPEDFVVWFTVHRGNVVQ